MKLINQKTDIKKFLIHKNILIFTDGSSNQNFPYKNINFLEFVNDKVILLDTNQKILNKNDFPNIPENYFYKLFTASNGYFILVDENGFDLNTFLDTKEALYSVNDKRIIYEGAIIGNRIFQDYIINGFGQTVINIFSIEKKSVVATYSLNKINEENNKYDKSKVSEFSDIYNNKVLISTLTNGEILLLDIEKGEPIKLFKDARIKDGLFQKEENSPIYIGLKFKTYIEIDVEKAEVIKQLDLEEYFKQKFNRSTIVPINTTLYQNGLIYFIADTNIVGVFDPEKIEVLDYYEFNFDSWQTMLKGGKENLQVKDNNIYCLDTQNNLYTLSYSPPK